jgi:uncharacterized DUF497 family protein
VSVRFEWDERKNASNVRKHGVDFFAAMLAFDDPMHITKQDREVDGEARWQTVGLVRGVLLLLVAHTIEDEDEEVIRILSAREVDAHERRGYEEGL